VATSAAPELIVVACEIKVACNRGQHLFRTYGRCAELLGWYMVAGAAAWTACLVETAVRLHMDAFLVVA
jgi:hypothetical protein